MDAGIYIVGYAETPVVHASGRSAYELAGEAFAQLLQRTGFDKNRIDGFCATAALSEATNPFHTAYLAEILGLEVDWLQTSSMGGSSFLSGVAAAAHAIRAGQCSAAMVLGADAPSTENSSEYRGYRAEFQNPTGLVRPLGAFGLLQNIYQSRHGDPGEALARIVVTQRRNALLNEHACTKLKRPLTVDDYRHARLVSDPLRLLDSVMFCDGANAILMMDERTANRHGFVKGVRIASYAERTNHRATDPTPDPLSTGFEIAGPRALSQAGLRTGDLDMLQLYDDFSIALLLQLEQIGFCAEGQGADFVMSHDFGPQGDLPINTGGGQLSVGQPGLAAGGLSLVEAVRQMYGEAGSLQVSGVSNCLVTGIGGIPHARNWMMSNAMVLVK